MNIHVHQCTLGVQNTLYLNSLIEGHRIHQLGSAVGWACVWLNFAKLADGFYDLKSRISCKIYSEPLKHALSPYKGPVESILNFIQNFFNIL